MKKIILLFIFTLLFSCDFVAEYPNIKNLKKDLSFWKENYNVRSNKLKGTEIQQYLENKISTMKFPDAIYNDNYIYAGLNTNKPRRILLISTFTDENNVVDLLDQLILLNFARYVLKNNPNEYGVQFLFLNLSEVEYSGIPKIFAEAIGNMNRPLPDISILFNEVADEESDFYMDKLSYERYPNQTSYIWKTATELGMNNFKKEINKTDNELFWWRDVGFPMVVIRKDSKIKMAAEIDNYLEMSQKILLLLKEITFDENEVVF